ncbi:hypothetical protein [Acinetobacter venetianus]|uniref:Uncharacterized protein n=1 Tax=Acinetobacter venetianus TaxID=52133 RepID=A0A150HX27_9GAMM|nr:hypothetical protein [Acinetobacter venetianus]KXZ71602.1 hypothetical protein AVENLUH13518_01178 [Acinetobacter venetianus]
MKKTIQFQDGSVQDFELNRNGFIQAVSYKESSADLKLSLKHKSNIIAAAKKSSGGYRGFFQMGESALFETGYYLGDLGVDFRKLNPEKEKLRIDTIRATFDKNDWKGEWSGKNGIHSFNDFLTKPELQLMAVSDWINYLCKRMQILNFNQYYGKIINGVEVTESGAIASAHLMGEGGLATFLGSPVFKKKSAVSDGNGTHISSYLSMFGGFDLESCCKRKIYIALKDSAGLELKNKEVTVVSKNNGKYISGETRVKVKSDENGNLPVIVRNPNTEIKIVADGKESNSIIQKANEKQKATLSDFNVTSHSATLEIDNTPQPRPQVNKTPQEVRNEQGKSSISQEAEVTPASKDINFNIEIVEGDSGKAISNMNFFLTYKGNIKKHTADSRGVKQGIIAEEGYDVEVSVAGDGQKQVIHHFQVTMALKNTTVKVKLPVHPFSISVTQDGKPVPNTLFSLFYRGREIPKRTNNRGVMNVRMLMGFVFGFGIKGKSLVLSRVEKSSSIKSFTVNGSAVQASKLYEVTDAKRKQAEDLKRKQQQKDFQEKKAKEEAEKAKTEPDKQNQTKQNNTYTESGGKPLTTVSNQSPPTSDTTRYHIYHDGKIKRENKTATGFAEFIYYDQKGKVHNLGKSRFVKAPMRKAGNEVVSGNCYLIDFTKHGSYRNGNIGYKWFMTGKNIRFYLNGITMSGILGTFMSLGYEEYPSSGGSLIDGSSQAPSVTHRNGEACDFRYMGKNNAHRENAIWTQNNNYDEQRNIILVREFRKFGFTVFYTQDGYNKKPKISGTSYAKNHYHHLHIGTCLPKIEDI